MTRAAPELRASTADLISPCRSIARRTGRRRSSRTQQDAPHRAPPRRRDRRSPGADRSTGTRSRISRCFALTSQSIRAAGNARRSAAATGMACTMSPSAPSRTIRKRSQRVVAVIGVDVVSERAIEQVARGVRFRVADDGRAAAVACDDGALGHRCRPCSRCPCSARPACSSRSSRSTVGVAEDDDVVDAAERGDELGAVGRGRIGRPRPLERRHRLDRR